MTDWNNIDVAFDAHLDTPTGKDPDTFSPTLRRYHKLLWGRTLPNGSAFELEDTTPPRYLRHRSALGEFILASDRGVPSFSSTARISHILDQIPATERDAFRSATWTIAGSIVFPATRVDGKMTINGARGFHPRIQDRFDLTLECIRRYYRDESSPLRDALVRYRSFFRLFDSFRGYISHFLLQDLVTLDCDAVRFFTPFDDFKSSPVPSTLEAYVSYRRLAVDFIHARGRRILELRSARPGVL